MVSRTRSVSSRSKSARSGSATSTTPRVGTTYGVHGEVLSKPPQGPKHTSHRAPKKTRKHKHLVLKWVLGIFAALIAAGIGLFAYMYITTEIPQPEKFALAEKTTVYYNDGTAPIGSYAEQNREIISCADLPDYVGNAIVASEDRSFYTNKGIDPIGIARAFYNNLTTGSRQGGSTITQQYAERYYLGETTSYVGKLREAFLAVKIAQAQDKSQVLCNYMNTIYLGRGAYGIQAAAKAYFGKDAKDLTLSEAAMLAGIIPAPSVWTPDVNPKQAEKRYKRVLNIMDEDGYITPDEKKAAKFPQTIEIQQNNQMSGPNGYLLTMVQNELVNTKAFSKQDLETGGYKIVTTIDKSKQDLMFSTISPSQNGMQGIVPDGMQFGALSVNPKDAVRRRRLPDQAAQQRHPGNVRSRLHHEAVRIAGRRQRRRQPQHVLQRQLVPDVPGHHRNGEQLRRRESGIREPVHGDGTILEHRVHGSANQARRAENRRNRTAGRR